MIGWSEAAEALGISKQGLHVWVRTEKIEHATDEDGNPVMLFTGQAGRPSRAFALAEVERAARANGRAAQFAAWAAKRQAARSQRRK